MKSHYIIELLEDIDRGRVLPLSSVKNIESVISEFVDEYESYEDMIRDLEAWNYVRLV